MLHKFVTNIGFCVCQLKYVTEIFKLLSEKNVEIPKYVTNIFTVTVVSFGSLTQINSHLQQRVI